MAERRALHADVIVVGAGLAGSLLACLLAQRGAQVRLLERRSDPRAAGFIGGRSINLALSTRGIDALHRVGLAESVLEAAIPMPGRMMHDRAGDLSFQPYGRTSAEAINSVSRGGLNVALLNAADQHANVTIEFDRRCVDADLDAPQITCCDAGGKLHTHSADLVIGADGAFSAVRGAMQITNRFSYSQSYLEHGYKELVIPPRPDGGFAIERDALHIWPRGGSMMIALPNQDGSFTCTLFWPFDGPDGFSSIRSDDDLIARFERDYPDAIPVMPTLLDDYRDNPTSSLVTIRCAPWHRGRTVILGDAAHAIVPFYGQGMNAAFEDCRVFDDLLDAHGDDWNALLPAFDAARIVHADAIADMAMDNFIEMRDRVASPLFVWKTRLEKRLHALLPSYTPLYNMVTFSRIPYAEARARAAHQDRVLSMIIVVLFVLLFVIPLALLTAFLL